MLSKGTNQNSAKSFTESKIDKQGRSYGTGRRKESTARVWVKNGSGRFNLNGVSKLSDYLKRESLCADVRTPFKVCDVLGKFDVFATCLLYTSPSPRDA